MRALLLTAFFGLLSGCGPKLAWSGHTQDRRHSIEIFNEGDADFITVDGVRRRSFAAIASSSLVSRGSDYAFAARVKKGWVVLHNDSESERWDGIADVALSKAGRLAFVGERSGRWQVVVDGKAGPRFDSVLAKTLRFDGSGQHYAYVAMSGGKMCVVVDGVTGPSYTSIGHFRLADNGKHYAYSARLDDAVRVVVDGVAGAPWRGVRLLQLSSEGAHVAYAATDGDSWRVVAGDKAGPSVESIQQVLLRPDGEHVGWIGKSEETLVIGLDQKPVAVAPLDSHPAIAFSPMASSVPGFAYVAIQASGQERIVVDQEQHNLFDEVGAPIWSTSGRLAYRARRGSLWSIIVDGGALPAGQGVGDPVFSSDGKRLGYVAHFDGHPNVVVDGLRQVLDLAFEDTLAFSVDGSRWSVVGGDLSREDLFFAIEGNEEVPLSSTELYSAALAPNTGNYTSNLLRAWSQAEAERAAAEESQGVAGAGAGAP